MGEKNLLELNPAPGDIFTIHYRASSSLGQISGTNYLRTHFENSDQFELLQVQKSDGDFLAKVKTIQIVGEPSDLFNMPKMEFKKLTESESIIQRIANTLVGFFMGG